MCGWRKARRRSSRRVTDPGTGHSSPRCDRHAFFGDGSRHSTRREHERQPVMSASSCSKLSMDEVLFSLLRRSYFRCGFADRWQNLAPQHQRSPRSFSFAMGTRQRLAKCFPVRKVFHSLTQDEIRQRLLGSAALLSVDAIYCSPLERARETAAPIALNEVSRQRLTEAYSSANSELDRRPTVETQDCPSGRQCGALRQRSGSLMARVSLKCGFAWCRHDRLRSAIRWHVVCVSHADPIKAAVAHAVGTHLDLFQRLSSPHARYQLSWSPHGPAVSR